MHGDKKPFVQQQYFHLFQPTPLRQRLATLVHKKRSISKEKCPKHAAALGLDVDLQATEKARALLGEQRHKTQNFPAMDWKDVPAFYQTFCQTTTLTQLALRLLILTGIRTNPLCHIREDQIEGDIWTILGSKKRHKSLLLIFLSVFYLKKFLLNFKG